MEFKEDKAIYMQIAEFVFAQILLGQWPEEKKIPSVRELAVNLEVNPNTVMRTYEMLQNMELIFNKRGIGYHVAQNAAEKIKVHRKQQFIEDELPSFFQNLYLLGMTLDELKPRFNEFVQTHFKAKTDENK